MRLLVLMVGCGVLTPLAWAHPGRTEAGFGHTVKPAYRYEPCEEAKGAARCPPSLPEEYHFHRLPFETTAEITAHRLPPDEQGRLRLWCEKGDKTRVEGLVRFRDDAGID